ncbi:MAG: hypothetical protein JWR27_2114 [Aeromicrobium sp.]|nr:hypothetical protein [Aeromicrobium sp.]
MIIAFVVVVWAAYFIPLALRRYDEASKNDSVETSGSLGRVISRPTPAPAAPVVAEKSDVKPVAAPAATEKPARTLDRPAARLAARRRRRTLLTLLALTAVVAILAGLGVAPVWALAVPVVLDIAWLVACRVQVRGELGLAVPKLPRKSETPVALDEEDTIIVSGQFEDINPGRKHQMESVALEVNALDDQIVIAVPSVSTAGEALWDPLPVTLPTYVTKPRAGRTVRTIDFSQPGTWTSGHIEGEDVELPKRADGPEQQRRAVGH